MSNISPNRAGVILDLIADLLGSSQHNAQSVETLAAEVRQADLRANSYGREIERLTALLVNHDIDPQEGVEDDETEE